MKIVLDRNVLVSGFLLTLCSSGEILKMVFSGELTLCLDARILAEYNDALRLPKFQFNRDHISVLFDFIKQYGYCFSSALLKTRLPDPDDEPFLEFAIAGQAVSLVTGNSVHYPALPFKGINIFPPSQFIEFYHNFDKSDI